MTDNKTETDHADGYTPIDQTEKWQDYKRGRDGDNPTQPDSVSAAAKRREQLLKNRLLETRIENNVTANKQRKQKMQDERERIRAEAIAEVDHEQNDRIAEIHERAHNWIARFFIVGCAIVFGFCGLWIAAFGIMILIGILSASLGFAI